MIYHRRAIHTFNLWLKNALLKGKPWRSFKYVLYHYNESIASKAYTYKVTMGKVLNGNIGYLSYDEFTGSSVAEFEAEFTKFKASGIKDIIVDLRYNGGGSVDVASILLENFTNRHAGKRQFYLDWNANSKSKNVDYYFSSEVEANDLDMQRVIFLVSRGSASASELVISALKPYLGESNVVTIGDYTHGKSVGMEGKSYGQNYYFLINFYVKNNMGFTSSANGIAPTCVATDDITHLRGDPEELMLKSAINYINTGNCL
jgi:C-terminal processing protease CtpA/Prc